MLNLNDSIIFGSKCPYILKMRKNLSKLLKLIFKEKHLVICELSRFEIKFLKIYLQLLIFITINYSSIYTLN